MPYGSRFLNHLNSGLYWQQTVILVERSPVSGAGTSHDQDINSSTVEEVRQAVTQFLQQQQQLETAGADTEIVQADAPEQQDQVE